jgi:WD40 repeat protein
VAGAGCGVKAGEEGDVDLGNVWLAAGHNDGSVRIWDLETERCVTTLHPMVDGSQSCYSRGVFAAPDWSRVVHFKKPQDHSPESGGLHVWDLSSDGTQERYVFVHGCKNSLGFKVASTALLYHDKSKRRSVEQCSSRVVRFEQSQESKLKIERSSCSSRSLREGGTLGCLMSREEDELSESTDSMLLMRFEDDFVSGLAERNDMCCRVANCEDRVLVADVDKTTGTVTVLDALTSEIINEFRTTEDHIICSVAAFQREDGRVLVVTGDSVGMIRMQMADSGELIGQRKALQDVVWDVAIAVKAGKVMGAYGKGGSWIWSFGKEGPLGPDESKSRAIADGMPSRATDDEARNNQSNHFHWIYSIAFSGDGKLAASGAYFDKFVLVWDTATGTVLRKLDINEAGQIRPVKVAVSSSGDWIMCASKMEGDNKTTFLNLWGPYNQEFSSRFMRRIEMSVCRFVTIKTSQDGLRGNIRFEHKEDGNETYEWALAGSLDPELVISPTAASDDVVSELVQARQGSQKLLLEQMNRTELYMFGSPVTAGGIAAHARPLQCLIAVLLASPHG